MGDPTPFQEANAILAAQEGDDAEVQRIIADMSPNELLALARAGEQLAVVCRSVADHILRSGPFPEWDDLSEADRQRIVFVLRSAEHKGWNFVLLNWADDSPLKGIDSGRKLDKLYGEAYDKLSTDEFQRLYGGYLDAQE